MNNKITFKELAKKVLESENIPLSPLEIWKRAEQTGLATQIGSVGKTPWQTIGAQIYMEIRNSPEKTVFTQFSSRPLKFFLKGIKPKEGFNLSFQEESQENSLEKEKNIPFLEKDLHPLLVRFFSVPPYEAYLKTLKNVNSEKKPKGLNEWIHPDIVGVRFPFNNFEKPTLLVQNKLYWTAVRFFSFEMKREITLGNCKEYYFQAVSNSSWANEGYLVALRIDEENDLLMRELKRLNNSFGIGVIKLNPEEIDESKILFSSKKSKEELDWETIDNLLKNNKDFKDFMELIETDITAGKVTNKDKYDHVLSSEEEIKSYSQDKKIFS